MEKLHLLEPEIATGYLGNGRREKVTYLNIPANLKKKDLRADIAAGAKHLKEVAELLDRKPSQFVIIDCENREAGQMAVTYMAAAFNEQENIEKRRLRSGERRFFYDDDAECFAEDSDDLRERLADDELESEDMYANANSYNLYAEDEDSQYEFDLEDEDDMLEQEAEFEWIENRYAIPIIQMMELRNYLDQKNMGFGLDNMMFGEQRRDLNPPFWTNCTTESICIECGMNTPAFDAQNMDWFKNNKHVYIIRTKDADFPIPFGNPFDDGLGDDLPFSNPRMEFQYEMLLEYSADTVKISMDHTDELEYYTVAFQNMIHRHGVELEKRFPLKKIMLQIALMNRSDKLHMMNRLIYVMKDKKQKLGESLVFTKKDLSELEVFRYVTQSKKKTVRAAAAQLEKELVGMDSVKKQIKEIIGVMKFNKLRAAKGLPCDNFHNVHVLLGAPGTAKSTVAKLLGSMMVEEKLLPNDRFVCVNGAELKGKYVGHSAPKTKQYFENYDIIMIDEAYSLTSSMNGEMDSYGQEVLAQLMIELEKHGTDKLVMFAGYGGTDVKDKDNRMLEFINANPGLKSRINSTIVFPSYNADEMVSIVHKQAELMHFNLETSADKMIREYFEKRCQDRTFGNGREARSLIENCQRFMAERVVNLPKSKQTRELLELIQVEDVKKALAKLSVDMTAQAGASATRRIGFAD